MFGEFLDLAGDEIDVLDIGAGPGHFAAEFLSRRPDSRVRFTLVDASAEMLRIAGERLGKLEGRLRLVRADFNSVHWVTRLGRYDAIVSNNALSDLAARRIPMFYRELRELLDDRGFFLNQQAFNPQAMQRDFQIVHRVLGPERFMRFDDANGPEQLQLAMSRMDEAVAQKDAAIFEAGMAQEEMRRGIDLSEADHLQAMRGQGWLAESIWRKGEYAVVTARRAEIF